MIVAGSANPLLLGQSQGYNLTKSLRFRASASAYLNRNAVTPTLGTKCTFSCWHKRGQLGSFAPIFSADKGSSYDEFGFESNDTFYIYTTNGAVGAATSAVFRDPSAWYHIVCAIDTTQTTASDRIKIYINGVQQTLSGTYPAQNYIISWQVNGIAQFIAKRATASTYRDGYLAEVNFIDGQALTPSSFGQTSSTTGVWQPIKYTGTYGTNGFYLPFTNTTSTTTLGNDFSGNGNNWTTNNISLTAGTTYDSMTDVPTNTDTNTANYATLNPLAMYGTNAVISNANLTSSATSTSNDRGWASTIAAPNSGKWYAEFTFTATNGDNNGGCGVMLENGTEVSGESATTVSWRDAGTLRQNATGTSYGSALTTNDVVIVAYDAALGRVWFGKNGTWFASGDPATNANPSATGITTSGRFATYHYNTVAVIQANFGQRPFSYTPPTGFKALNTFNLPTPTIGATASTTANNYFNAVLYSGNNSTQTITTGFQPDFIWSKCRNVGRSHRLIDSVRGLSYQLFSDTTDGGSTYDATSYVSSITSTNSSGFAVTNAGTDQYNTSGENYVSWAWKANGSGSTNTAGSITSTVSANTTAGFSIVTFNAGTAGNKTVGHGLGVKPAMVIFKDRTTTSSWLVWHQSLSSQTQSYLILQTTAASANDSRIWANTAPTSTVLSFESGYSFDINDNIVAYCFAQIAGYSAFGSYTGNGSTDGPFIFTGFRPRYIMWKASTAAYNWNVIDTSRNPYNVTDALLRPNTSDAESIGGGGSGVLDILSNGFKLRSAYAGWNDANTYIYMAFAESPFKYALAR